MNLECPTCGRVALSIPRKLLSSRVFPSRCRNCSALVAAKWSIGRGLLESAIDHVLLIGGALVSLFMWSWWPLMIAFALDMTVVPVIVHWSTPLVVLRAEDVSRSRRVAIVASLVFVVVVVIAGMTDR